MRLEAEAPMRMRQYIFYDLRCILTGTGLKKIVFGWQCPERLDLLSGKNKLYLIYAVQLQRSPFRRTSYPINSIRNGMRPIGFYTDIFPDCMKTPDQILINPEGRLSSGSISSSLIHVPLSCCVSQKSHFKLHPEKRINSAGVPVWNPSP